MLSPPRVVSGVNPFDGHADVGAPRRPTARVVRGCQPLFAGGPSHRFGQQRLHPPGDRVPRTGGRVRCVHRSSTASCFDARLGSFDQTSRPVKNTVALRSSQILALFVTLSAFADAPKLPRIGAAMQAMIAKNEIAGAVTVVVSKDGLLHLEYGSQESDRRVTIDSSHGMRPTVGWAGSPRPRLLLP